jgi:ATP phosphoribosyltransferase regulatory subunit
LANVEILRSGERASLSLRSLYKQYGYLPFKMSKFEEYDLYVKNKEFLVGENVITFNDTDGRLLALKPDVTLSIIKNTAGERGCKQKFYYNENVYRVSQKTHRFKEIMQTGLECIGDIDIYDIYEAIYLSAKSLALVSEDFVLDLSHLGLLSRILDFASDSPTFKREITALIAEKNKHEIKNAAERYELSGESCELILSLVDIYGSIGQVLPRLYPICRVCGATDIYEELSALCGLLGETDFADKIKLDFSLTGDMNYYNGIVFKGFLSGIPEGVLSGGEYGTLMQRMGKAGGAVGFAFYLDLLSDLEPAGEEYDVDVLLIYDEKCDTGAVISLKNSLVASGKSVSLQKAIPQKLRYRQIMYAKDAKGGKTND